MNYLEYIPKFEIPSNQLTYYFPIEHPRAEEAKLKGITVELLLTLEKAQADALKNLGVIIEDHKDAYLNQLEAIRNNSRELQRLKEGEVKAKESASKTANLLFAPLFPSNYVGAATGAIDLKTGNGKDTPIGLLWDKTRLILDLAITGLIGIGRGLTSAGQAGLKKSLTKAEGLQNFINNDVIPRARAAGHNVSGEYRPVIRTIDPTNDLFDAAQVNKNAGAWFTPTTNDITLRGPIESTDFGLLAHEAGGHGFRYNLLPDYRPTTRKFLNEFIENGAKADPNTALGKELSKTHLGNQLYTNKEISALEEAYPWVKLYKAGNINPLQEQGAINTLFRAKLSENGKIVGAELDKRIDEFGDYDLFNFLKELPYTASIIDDVALKTGISADDIIFMPREEFSNLLSRFPQIKDQLNKIKYAMKYVGGVAAPITISETNNDKRINEKMNYIDYYKSGSKIHIKKANKGKFTDYCGGKVTSECIAKGKHSPSATIRKRATFAANARKWKHEEGGIIKAAFGDSIVYSTAKNKERSQNLFEQDNGFEEIKNYSLTPKLTDQTSYNHVLTWDDLDKLISLQSTSKTPIESTHTATSGPRGYRNYNPLNIRISSNPWSGKVSDNTDGSFEQFTDMAHGFRAGIKNMQTWINRGKNTLRNLISTWAPDSDGNNSSSYAKHVSDATGIGLDDVIDPNNKDQMTKIAYAMAKVENGIDANMDDVIAGWNLI